MQVLDEDKDPSAGVTAADADVVQAAVVPQRDDAGGVEAVLTDAEVPGVDGGAGRNCCGAGGEGLGGGAAADRAMRPVVVVVADEGVELSLQRGQ